MKKYHLLSILVLFGLLSSCGNGSNSDAKIAMTTVSDDIEIWLYGTGLVTITWEKEIAESVRLEEDHWKGVKCVYRYADERLRTITINGGNITVLRCNHIDLISLDVRGNTELEELYCDSNMLTSLDLSKNTALTLLDCDMNKLMKLDLSTNTALTELNCSMNNLTSLDISKNTALTMLDCDWNQLTSLDLSKNTALKHLSCNSNQLKSLNLSKNVALDWLSCNNNQLSADALDNLFGSLYETDAGGQMLYISGNPGLTGCEVFIATNKGWNIMAQ